MWDRVAEKNYFPFCVLTRKDRGKISLLTTLLFNERKINLLGNVEHSILSSFRIKQTVIYY